MQWSGVNYSNLRQDGLIDIADAFYWLLTGHIDSSDVLESFFQTPESCSQEISEKERHRIIKFWRNQASIQPYLNRWRYSRNLPDSQKSQEARKFIRSVIGSIRNDAGLLSYANRAGRNHRCADGWSDHYTCRPEKKAGWTLHFTAKGSGTYNCLRKKIITSPGDLLLFSPDAYIENHRTRSSSEWDLRWLLFQRTANIQDILDWPEIAPGTYKLTTKTDSQRQALIDLLDSFSKLEVDDSDASTRIRSTVVEHLLLRCWKLIPNKLSRGKDCRIEQAENFIMENLCSDFTLHDVADHAALSVSRFSVLFKEKNGVSPLHWRDEQRMKLACRRLIEGDSKVSEVASSVGYENQLYFSRIFKRYLGVSPSEYRGRTSLIKPGRPPI